MTVQRFLPVADIRRRADARPLNDAKVGELAESIAHSPDRQPFNPILVRFLTAGYELLAGGHRLAAMESLGEPEIICSEVDCDDLHAELVVIDENLIRSELSTSERAAQVARRKAIYEQLHPETVRESTLRQGTEVPSRKVCETGNVSRFTAETATATGRSERAVQLDAERGEKITSEALKAVTGSPLDKGVYLDELKNVSPAEQFAKVRRDLAASKDVERERRKARQAAEAQRKSSVKAAADRAEAHAEAKRLKELAQAESDRLREEHLANLSPEVRQREEAKAAAKASKREDRAADERIAALEAEISELREANAALEADLAVARAENRKWDDMRVPWEMGGYEAIVSNLKHQIAVLGGQVETISRDRAAYLRQMKRWRDRAIELGYSSEEVIDLREGSNG